MTAPTLRQSRLTERLRVGLLILASASLVAFVSGYAAVVLLAVRQRVLHRLIWTGREFWWMVPVAEQGFVLALAAPLAALALVRRSPRLVPVATALATAVVAFAFLRLLTEQRVHPVAMALLALGLSLQAGRWVDRHPGRWRRLVVRLVPFFVVLTGVAAALQTGARRLNEARLIRSLPASGAGPNVLLLVLDTVRGASLSLYGYPRPTSTKIDQFAARGVTFDRAYSPAPWTLASHASMFTGLPPWRLTAGFLSPLDDGPSTLAEALGARGYLTAGFAANHIYATYETGLARGFQHYEDYRVTPRQIGLSAELGQLLSDKSSTLLIRSNHRTYAATSNAQFLAWLGTGKERPFFAFVNYMDAHLPYQTPPEWIDRFRADSAIVDRYDAAIGHLDARIGDLLGELEHRGVLENTIVIITSDHGEHLGDHGIDDHANSLYTQLLRVPLVIVGPGIPAGKRVESPVTMTDLAATVIELAGGAGTLPGTSLARFWRGEADAGGEIVMSHVDRHPSGKTWYRNSTGALWSAISGRYHLILNPDESVELFDVAADPAENETLTDRAGLDSVVSVLRAAIARSAAEDLVARRATR